MTDAPRPADAHRFVRPLPAKPNLEKQRKLAKALARDYWRGEKDVVARVEALHPKPPSPQSFALSDAQLAIARGHGFASWAKLKHKIEQLTKSPIELFAAAVQEGDLDAVRRRLETDSELRARINAPLFAFKQTARHVAAGNLAMLDLLLAHGADLNVKSSWDQGGFGILETVTPEQAAPLIARGATIDVWAAANLGMGAELRSLIDADPALVNAKGGDGKRPLHYARKVELARFLLEHGAEIDALDDDPHSTPWSIPRPTAATSTSGRWDSTSRPSRSRASAATAMSSTCCWNALARSSACSMRFGAAAARRWTLCSRQRLRSSIVHPTAHCIRSPTPPATKTQPPSRPCSRAAFR
jgi:hypothetical protein